VVNTVKNHLYFTQFSDFFQEFEMTERLNKSSNELAEDRTILATGRTLMAADRSLMAWIRTALSMISFGFTIYKVLQGFQETGAAAPHDYSPKTIGLFLTGMGTLSMVAGTIEYWGRIKQIRHYHPIRTLRASFLLALIMSATGLFLFLSIITNVL
jgi:putative membrane protein